MKIFNCFLSCLVCFSGETCLKDRIDSLKQEATIFVQQEESIEPGSKELVLKEIFNRLNDSALWLDPEKYHADWIEKRGFTREFRISEDNARIFFEKHVFIQH